MATVTLRLPDEKHERLEAMAKHYGISLPAWIENPIYNSCSDHPPQPP